MVCAECMKMCCLGGKNSVVKGLITVKRSRAILQCGEAVKNHFCSAVKRSSCKNDGQDFLTPVAALTVASMGVSPPWSLIFAALVVYTVLNGWADTTCLSSLSTHLAPTPLFSGVLLSPNPGRLIRTLRYHIIVV